MKTLEPVWYCRRTTVKNCVCSQGRVFTGTDERKDERNYFFLNVKDERISAKVNAFILGPLHRGRRRSRLLGVMFFNELIPVGNFIFKLTAIFLQEGFFLNVSGQILRPFQDIDLRGSVLVKLIHTLSMTFFLMNKDMPERKAFKIHGGLMMRILQVLMGKLSRRAEPILLWTDKSTLCQPMSAKSATIMIPLRK